jgi:hypothetical protein
MFKNIIKKKYNIKFINKILFNSSIILFYKINHLNIQKKLKLKKLINQQNYSLKIISNNNILLLNTLTQTLFFNKGTFGLIYLNKSALDKKTLSNFFIFKNKLDSFIKNEKCNLILYNIKIKNNFYDPNNLKSIFKYKSIDNLYLKFFTNFKLLKSPNTNLK